MATQVATHCFPARFGIAPPRIHRRTPSLEQMPCQLSAAECAQVIGAATPLLRDTLTVEEEESARVLLRSLSAPGTPG